MPLRRAYDRDCPRLNPPNHILTVKAIGTLIRDAKIEVHKAAIRYQLEHERGMKRRRSL